MHLFGSHFGTYEVEAEAGGAPRLAPFRFDPSPSEVGARYLDLARHESRVLHPMVRRGWLEHRDDLAGRGRDRGRDTFVSVGWDEAACLVAGEIDLVRRDHTNEAIFAGSYGWASAGRLHHAQSQLKRFLNLCGGFVSSVGTYSYGAATVLLPHIIGRRAAGETDGPSFDLIAEHAQAVISFGGFRLSNAQVGAGGVGRHRSRQWLERIVARGARVIVVSPTHTDVPTMPGPQVIEFVRIRPNTDVALMLAMAHEIVVGGLAQRGFIDRYTVGFEAFAAYVMGDTDGTPKTADWAAALCGIPAETIRALARTIATQPTLLNAAWSLQRARYGEQPYWAMVCLAAITGQIGRPGCGFAFGLTATSAIGQPVRRLRGPAVPQGENPVKTFIPVARLTELLEQPGETLDFDGCKLALPDIRLVYWAGGNPFHHHQDLNRLANAWRRPETVIVNESMWTATARHADIVLPASLPFERNDLVVASKDAWIVASRQVMPPPADVMNDRDIFARLAREFGFETAFLDGRDEAAWLRSLYEGYRETYPELLDFETFWDRGYAALDPDRDAPAPFVPFADFIADPTGRPLDTPSGRVELASTAIAAMNYPDMPGHPVWRSPEESFASAAVGPGQLHLLSPQPGHRLHSQLECARVSTEAKVDGREVAFVNPGEAERRGLVDGQLAEIYNDRGCCLVALRTSREVEPDLVVLPTGSWFDPVILPDGSLVDLGGNPNTLTSIRPTSSLAQGSAPNSCLVEIRPARPETIRALSSSRQ
ncbi:molybdopterin-dependent oxidoreductase [Consotaella aegiceratis]|uniref:molybdopterin-dependent oxidoreductase n=1 Tax=Consotaella aegiceratis TaxID=3097961 RepID=UPI002F4275C0